MTRRTKTIIAVLAVCIFAGWTIPHFIRARSNKDGHCIYNLRRIDAAKKEWALDYNKTNGAVVAWNDLIPYLWPPDIPVCPDGGVYTIGKAGEKPTCSIGGKEHTLPDSN
jgi:hypothetical protein